MVITVWREREREREGVSFIDFWNKIKQEIITTIKILKAENLKCIHTVGPANKEVPESAIAEQPPAQYPETQNSLAVKMT